MRALRIARLKERSRVLGPGCRAVVWTHGCSRGCPGCIAKEMNESPEELLFAPEALAAWVRGIDGIEGLTVSGGEPFEQDLEALAVFLRLVKAPGRELSVLCYTGFRREELGALPGADEVLRQVDILVDGPYVEALNEGNALRGSSNQRILALNEGLSDWALRLGEEYGREVELSLSKDLSLELTGIPQPGFLEKLRRSLAARDFDFVFRR